MQLTAIGLFHDAVALADEVRLVTMLITSAGMPDGNGDDAAPDDEEIPWAPIYHKAREVIGMTDGEFWSTSPRKYFAILNEALVYRGIKKAPEIVEYMDDIF